MKVRKNNKTMFGFSVDQLLLLFAVCFLVLGPKKTVEMAYRLGIQARKVKSYYDSCKREFGLTDLESVKNSFSQSSKDMEQKINSMSYELKHAMKTDEIKKELSFHNDLSKEDNLSETQNHDMSSDDNLTSGYTLSHDTSSTQDLTSNLDKDKREELDLRIAALEVELIKIKAKLLQSQSEKL